MMSKHAPFVAFWIAVAVILVAAIVNDALVDIYGCL